MEFKDRLKELREELNKTQKEVANNLDIPYINYHKYEKGIHEPDIETIKTLAAYFDVSIDYLLGKTLIRNIQHAKELENIYIALDKDLKDLNLTPDTLRKIVSIAKELRPHSDNKNQK